MANNLRIQSNTTSANGALYSAALLRQTDNAVSASAIPDISAASAFVARTWIETAAGQTRIQDLRAGDLVMTADAGAQPIVRMRKITMPYTRLAEQPHLKPIRLPDGFLGASRPLLVSPEQRIMISSPMAELMFDASEVLAVAKDFIGLGAEAVMPLALYLEYYQILLSDHHILKANGVTAESLFVENNEADEATHPKKWEAADDLKLGTVSHTQVARPVLKKFEVEALMTAVSNRSNKVAKTA